MNNFDNDYRSACTSAEQITQSLMNAQSLNSTVQLRNYHTPAKLTFGERLRRAFGVAQNPSTVDLESQSVLATHVKLLDQSCTSSQGKSRYFYAQSDNGEVPHRDLSSTDISLSFDNLEEFSRATSECDPDSTDSEELSDHIASKWDSDYTSADPSPAPPAAKSMNTGIVFMCVAGLFNVVSSSLSQSIQASGSSSAPNISDILLFRCLPLLIVSYIMSCVRGTKLIQLPKMNLGMRVLYLVRLLCPSLTFIFTCFSLGHLQVSIYTVIFQTNPFLVSLMMLCIMGISISRSELAAMAICFAAVIFIATNKSEPEAEGLASVSSTGNIIGMVFALLAATSNGFVCVVVAKCQNIDWTVQLFHVACIGCLFTALNSLCQVFAQGEASVVSLTQEQAVKMTLLGLSDTIFLICVVQAYQRGKPSSIALFSYTNLIYAFFADTIIFGRAVSLSQLIPTLLIATVTISLGIYMSMTSSKQNQPQQSSKDIETKAYSTINNNSFVSSEKRLVV